MSNEVKILIGISALTLVIVVGAALLFGGTSSKKTGAQAQPVKNVEALMRSDSHVIKAPLSKVTLVEFGDFQCPACGAAHPTITKVLETYKGKINFVFRNFPLPMHKNAQPAAEAAEAAGAQGKFFEMYDILYVNQKEWGESDKAMDYFLQYAKELKLDIDKFKTDVESKKHAKKIQKDVNDGYAVGVNATPTFFINGVPQESSMTFEDFKKQIDQALKNS